MSELPTVEGLPHGGTHVPLIERFRERLPFEPGDPLVSLQEGSTPLLRAPVLSEMLGATVRLKLEGANPTGSFKDRGMTCAVSAAVREGAKAVICASTGNTAASAAAYAARAGITCAVIVPEGKIAQGKMAQTLMHGARVISLAGNFDQALELVRELTSTHAIVLVNSVNEFRIEGQKTAAFEILEALEGDLDALCIPVGNAGNITSYWRGFTEMGAAPRLLGLQAAGRRADRRGPRDRAPGNGRQRDQDRQPGALGGRDGRGDRLARLDQGRQRRGDPRAPTGCWRRREGMFCEPASAASVAGLLKYGAEGARADRVRAHRPRAEGPRDGDRPPRRRDDPVRAPSARRSRKRCWVIRRRVVRVPASSANLGPGFDCMAAAVALRARARGHRDRAASRSRPSCRSRAGARTCACGPSSACTRPTPSPSRSARRSRCRAGWARARRRSSPA